MNDLNAASLDDVKTWFRTWYGPNNAVLVLAGDIDAKTAKEKVAKYFGDIPPGRAWRSRRSTHAPLAQAGRTVLEDRKPQAAGDAGLERGAGGTREADELDLFARRCSAARPTRAWTSAWCTTTSSPTR